MNKYKRSFDSIVSSYDKKAKKCKTNLQEFKQSFDKLMKLFGEMGEHMDKHPNCLTVELKLKKYLDEHEVNFYLWKHRFTNTRFYCCTSISKSGLDFSWQTNINDLKELKCNLSLPIPIIVTYDWVILTGFESPHDETFF